MNSQLPSNTRWLIEREETVLTSPVVSLLKRHCRLNIDAARTYTFYVLKSPDWCNIIPVTADGKVVLIRQYRIGTDTFTLEIPGGVVDRGDGHGDEAVGKAALRELEEETGYTLKSDGRCVSLGWSHPNPAMQGNRVHFFVAGPVEKTKQLNLDPGEVLFVEEVAISDLPGLLAQGQITHALIQNCFLALLAQSPDWGRVLETELRKYS